LVKEKSIQKEVEERENKIGGESALPG